MRLPLSSRLIATVLIAAIACFLYVTDAGLTASFASEGDSTSQAEEASTLESLIEQIAALEARIIDVEANQDELAAQELAYPIFDAIAAVYLMDQVDIHALHRQLDDGEGIMPGDSGQFKRLVPLLSAVDWPPELVEEGTSLVETLVQLSTALADDDLECALPLAEKAHEAQHHFSSSVSAWFEDLLVAENGDDEDSQADDNGDGHEHTHGHGDDDNASHSHDNGSQADSEDEGIEGCGDGNDDGHDHSH